MSKWFRRIFSALILISIPSGAQAQILGRSTTDLAVEACNAAERLAPQIEARRRQREAAQVERDARALLQSQQRVVHRLLRSISDEDWELFRRYSGRDFTDSGFLRRTGGAFQRLVADAEGVGFEVNPVVGQNGRRSLRFSSRLSAPSSGATRFEESYRRQPFALEVPLQGRRPGSTRPVFNQSTHSLLEQCLPRAMAALSLGREDREQYLRDMAISNEEHWLSDLVSVWGGVRDVSGLRVDLGGPTYGAWRDEDLLQHAFRNNPRAAARLLGASVVEEWVLGQCRPVSSFEEWVSLANAEAVLADWNPPYSPLAETAQRIHSGDYYGAFHGHSMVMMGTERENTESAACQWARDTQEEARRAREEAASTRTDPAPEEGPSEAGSTPRPSGMAGALDFVESSGARFLERPRRWERVRP